MQVLTTALLYFTSAKIKVKSLKFQRIDKVMHISEMSNLDMRSYMYNFPMNTYHTQSKHMSAIFIHEMKPAHTTELS